MTREEAIKRFETLLLHVDTDCVMGMETTEAINMAIKALEHRERETMYYPQVDGITPSVITAQSEPCEDAIVLKRIKKSVDTIMNTCRSYSIRDKAFRNAARLIQNAIDGNAPQFEEIEESFENDLCEDAVSRKKVFEYFVPLWECIGTIMDRNEWEDVCKTTANELPPVTPKQRWIPVTLETLPNPNSVVVVCEKRGTWDFGMYSGWYGDVHSWKWKKNTIKHVYWWMRKIDALPEPYREEGGE